MLNFMLINVDDASIQDASIQSITHLTEFTLLETCSLHIEYN